MPRTLGLINQKGGVGKTTSATNIGAALARQGHRVLLVDLDPQSHLTCSLGIDPEVLRKSAFHVLKGTAPAQEAIVERSANLWVLPSDRHLAATDLEIGQLENREFMLRNALGSVLDHYDYIVVDGPPTLGLLALNVLTAIEELLIPIQPEYLALQGLGRVMDTVDLVRQRLNHQLSLAGVIMTRFDGRKSLNREVKQRVEEFLGEGLLCAVIHDNVAVAEAPSFGQSIFEYKPRSRGAKDYSELAQLIAIGGQHGKQKVAAGA